MPKKMVAGPTDAGGDFGVAALPTWQAAGLSLAVIVGHVFNGSGALVFGLLSVGGDLDAAPPARARTARANDGRPHRVRARGGARAGRSASFSSSRTC